MPRNSITNPTPKKLGSRDNGRDDATIRVGREFQAEIPKHTAIDANTINDTYCDSLNICIWEPSDRLDQHDVEIYVESAVKDHGYSVEQALGILFFNEYDTEQSKQDVLDYCPVEDPIDSWEQDDRILFETAYKLNSKSFSKIQETLPNKKISELVHYYYTWKKNKTKHKTSCRTDRPSNRNRLQGLSPDSKIGQLSPGPMLNSTYDYSSCIDVIDCVEDFDIFMDGEPISLDLQEYVKILDRNGLQVKHRIQKTKQNIEMMRKKSPRNLSLLKEARID